MTRHFCTYFDQNYIPRALIMLESLHRHAPEALVHVLCLNSVCQQAMRALALPFVRLYSLDELEKADPQLLAVKADRSTVEYYFTLTPCLPHFLLQNQDLDEITYLDADMVFFASPEALFTEAGAASVIITPHRFSKALEAQRAKLETYGLYNVSWLTFRAKGSGGECLAWYRQACLEWCFDRVEGDRYADQKYLEAFPRLFDGVHIMVHNGGGVAPWNLAGARLEEKNGCPHIDGVPLIFYHAQAFSHLWGPFYASGGYEYRMSPAPEQKALIFRPYIRAYTLAVRRAQKLGLAPQKGGPRLRGQGGLRKLLRRLRHEMRRNTLLFHL